MINLFFIFFVNLKPLYIIIILLGDIMSITTEQSYIIKDTGGSRIQQPFPIISILFPRLHKLLMLFFGRFFGFSAQTFYGTYRPRTRITEIRRSEDGGWQILEYEQ